MIFYDELTQVATKLAGIMLRGCELIDFSRRPPPDMLGLKPLKGYAVYVVRDNQTIRPSAVSVRDKSLPQFMEALAGFSQPAGLL
jgi:hypothetical protein